VTKRVVLAIAAHPDDIELMMAGTLALLGRAGFALHMMNIANGSCGSKVDDAETTARRRFEEASAAAKVLNAVLHPPLTNDLEIFYEEGLLRRIAAVVREVDPSILLLHSPVDYMEDHTNACRLGVTAAFTRSMPNFVTEPRVPPVAGEITLYHSLPWGLRGPLGERSVAGHIVDIGETMPIKRRALACHVSQKEWLDQTQGLDSYLDTMADMAEQVGRESGRFKMAEGWRRHLHLGFCGPDADPLRDALGDGLVQVMEGK
jgi:LmbE family N-acetylglucosaminyl deacetylase